MNCLWIRFPNCSTCDGYGWVIGGDEPVQCPACSLRQQRLDKAASLVRKQRRKG